MSLTIEPKDKFLLISFSDESINQKSVSQLEEYAANADEENYIVLDFSNIKTVDSEMLRAIEVQLQKLISTDGLIVFASNDEKINTDIAATFNDPDLIILPTVDEAVDYIFMDEIENDLGGEG
jgi:anti-sigma B factor antagonist